MSLNIVYDDLFLEHSQGPFHPESPDRLRAIKSALEETSLWKKPLDIAPFPPELLEKIHSKDYIKKLEDEPPGPLDPDTAWHEKTFGIAMKALSGAYTGAKTTFETGNPSLCLLRPPGHHSGPDYFGGFCYFNNAALAAETARTMGAERVAIVDIDVHHGNGTRDIMASRKDVLYISTHQWGIFPGTGPPKDVGEGEGKGYTANLALPSGSGDRTYEMAFEDVAMPLLDEFKPEMLVVSIGMDAHYMDPLATLSLSSPGYMSLCKQLSEKAKQYCSGKIVYVLEGGYNLKALGDVAVGLATLLDRGETSETEFDLVRDHEGEGRGWVDTTKDVLKEYWTL